MAGWTRIIRGVVGTGLTFAVGVGTITTVAGLIMVALGKASFDDLRMAGKLSVVAFILGVAFSGIVAVASRRRRFTQLSIPRFAAMGAGAGLLYYLLIGLNGAFSSWSSTAAIANFVLLTVLGGAAATGTVVIARRAGPLLRSGDDVQSLDESDETRRLSE